MDERLTRVLLQEATIFSKPDRCAADPSPGANATNHRLMNLADALPRPVPFTRGVPRPPEGLFRRKSIRLWRRRSESNPLITCGQNQPLFGLALRSVDLPGAGPMLDKP